MLTKITQILLLSATYCCLFSGSYAQKIATLEVDLPSSTHGLEMPVSVNLDEITFLPDSVLSLVRIQNNGAQDTKMMPVPFQIEQTDHRQLYWMVRSEDDQNKPQVFELEKSKPAAESNRVEAVDKNGALTIKAGDKNLLRYHYETVYPPAGVDSAYQRSGFIHPLWSPRGQVLTRIQPPDHYHHYGIWNPWTHVLYEGDTVDFWNLVKKEGTVRFVDFASTISGSVYSGYDALLEHVVFKADGNEKVALDELQSVKVYYPQNDDDYYIVDLSIQMNCADENPFRILEYRYEGLGWRATEQWNKDNSEQLSSTGKTRENVDGSRERWCIVQGEVDGKYAGAVMMSYPTNYNHPEPMRNWPVNANDRGDVFASFCPTKDRDWLLKPGQNYVLKYRLLVFNDRFTPEKAESAWQYYATPPKVKVTKK